MIVTIDRGQVYIRLSRRNLRQLSALLHGQDAHRTCLTRKDENGVSLIVRVEEDADHYGRRANARRSS